MRSNARIFLLHKNCWYDGKIPMICYIYSNSGSHNSFSPQTSSWECLTWRTELKGIEKNAKK